MNEENKDKNDAETKIMSPSDILKSKILLEQLMDFIQRVDGFNNNMSEEEMRKANFPDITDVAILHGNVLALQLIIRNVKELPLELISSSFSPRFARECLALFLELTMNLMKKNVMRIIQGKKKDGDDNDEDNGTLIDDLVKKGFAGIKMDKVVLENVKPNRNNWTIGMKEGGITNIGSFLIDKNENEK